MHAWAAAYGFKHQARCRLLAQGRGTVLLRNTVEPTTDPDARLHKKATADKAVAAYQGKTVTGVVKAKGASIILKGVWLIWLTGLSGAGKSTLAEALVERLRASHQQVLQLDGDIFRKEISCDLGFSAEDRAENLRRASSVARLLLDGGTNVAAAFVSPYRADRDRIRAMFASGSFAEVYVRCPLEICEERDPKGLYARVRVKGIANFTGISDPYEEPLNAELVLDTDRDTVEVCVAQLEALVHQLQARPDDRSTPAHLNNGLSSNRTESSVSP